MIRNSIALEVKELSRNDPGLAAARRLARKHDDEPGHAFQVTKIAGQLFDETRDLHDLDAPERRLLLAAAMLHDTGYGVAPDRHHKGARSLILKSALDGFTPRELMIVACVARYHRKARPKKTHRVYRDLDGGAQLVVDQLAAILRIADGLDRAHDAATRKLRAERTSTGLRILVEQRCPSTIDIDGATRKRALFEEVFDLQVEIMADSPLNVEDAHD